MWHILKHSLHIWRKLPAKSLWISLSNLLKSCIQVGTSTTILHCQHITYTLD